MDTDNDPELFFDADVFDLVEESDVEEQISMILTDMDLTEKVGQMTQLTLGALSKPGEEQLDADRLKEAVVEYKIGSVFNVWSSALAPEEWLEVIATIQEAALLETRLGIPILFGIDSVHGANYTYGATLFPHNLGLAAAWDPELVAETTAVTAQETAACGIRWIFAPVLDVGRQPLWSRFIETFGEDVHLATRLGLAAVSGIAQSGEPVAACGKHFVGYGVPRSGHDRTAASIPDHELRDLHVPPFAACIRAGISSIMINSAVLNGEPVHASRSLIDGLLRKELGFDGVIVSDWEDVIKLHTVHHVADSEKEATRMAIEAGLDISMTPHSLTFAQHLRELVEEGTIPESRIDDSVRRILRLKHQLGLFDQPFPAEDSIAAIGSDASIELSRRASVQSITVLKNERDLLPLRPDSKVLVSGPASDSVAATHGPWSYTWQGSDEGAYPDDLLSVAAGLEKTLGSRRVRHVKGIDWEEDIDSKKAVDAARQADVVVVCVGEPPSVEKPGDIDDLLLSDIQIDFVMRLAETGTPLVLVLLQDRPRIIESIEPLCDAVVLAYRPGPGGPEALAAILTGAENPSGRLPFTYPRHPNGVVPYDHMRSETLSRGYGLSDGVGESSFDPQYPFGAGLSYTRFAYSNLKVSPKSIGSGDTVSVSVEVTNTGERPGREVVQLYVSDEYASVPPPVRRLKDFQSVRLAAGAKTKVSFELRPDALALTTVDGLLVAEAGRFTVNVGGLTASFALTEPAVIPPHHLPETPRDGAI